MIEDLDSQLAAIEDGSWFADVVADVEAYLAKRVEFEAWCVANGRD